MRRARHHAEHDGLASPDAVGKRPPTRAGHDAPAPKSAMTVPTSARRGRGFGPGRRQKRATRRRAVDQRGAEQHQKRLGKPRKDRKRVEGHTRRTAQRRQLTIWTALVCEGAFALLQERHELLEIFFCGRRPSSCSARGTRARSGSPGRASQAWPCLLAGRDGSARASGTWCCGCGAYAFAQRPSRFAALTWATPCSVHAALDESARDMIAIHWLQMLFGDGACSAARTTARRTTANPVDPPPAETHLDRLDM